jgi:hypothetical protein
LLYEFASQNQVVNEHGERQNLQSPNPRNPRQNLKEQRIRRTHESPKSYLATHSAHPGAKLAHPAQQRLEIDLDDGVKTNYLKFTGAVQPIPDLAAKED